MKRHEAQWREQVTILVRECVDTKCTGLGVQLWLEGQAIRSDSSDLRKHFGDQHWPPYDRKVEIGGI